MKSVVKSDDINDFKIGMKVRYKKTKENADKLISLDGIGGFLD